MLMWKGPEVRAGARIIEDERQSLSVSGFDKIPEGKTGL
jgi:hypothetical protein